MREATEGFYPDRNMTRGWGEAGDAMTAAVDRVPGGPGHAHRDIGGTIGCAAFGQPLAAALSTASETTFHP